MTIEATNNGLTDIDLTTAVTHDEYLGDFEPSDGSSDQPEEQGAGHTINDASPFLAHDSGASPVDTHHEIRAERSGRGDGRTYTIHAEASDMGGTRSCSGDVTVEVPHDMGNGAESKPDQTTAGS